MKSDQQIYKECGEEAIRAGARALALVEERGYYEVYTDIATGKKKRVYLREVE